MIHPTILEHLQGAMQEDPTVARWGWGAISVADGAVAQGSIGTTPVKVTAFTTDAGDGRWVIPSASNSTLTLMQGGIYLVGLFVSFSGSVSTEFNMHVYDDGAATALGLHRVIGTGGDVGSAGNAAPLAVGAGSVLECRVEAGASGKSITVVDATLFAIRLGPS